MQRKIILYVSLPLAFLVATGSAVGLLTPEFYAAETLNWQIQSIGQDMIELFLITPCLIISAGYAYRKSRAATLLWGGVMLYLTYTFVLYCFNVHFNKLFVLYCLCLGLSFYSLSFFLWTQLKWNTEVTPPGKTVTRIVSIYFIIIAVLFYVLWLAEIIPAVLQGTIPKSVLDAGLFTNGVQVLDLAIVLPAIFITGVFLWRRIPAGFVLAPVFLCFFVLMDITIGALAFLMHRKGVASDVSLTFIMAVLAAVSLWLLIWLLKKPGIRD